MRRWLITVLFCATLSSTAWAADFTREEIAIMHEAGVRMALVGETKPYVIPADIAPEQLVKTELLDFSGNSVVTVPEWLGKFTQLRKLDLSNAGIKADTALLNALGNMPQLEVLNLSGNPLFVSGGSLAGVWGKLPGLRDLNLAKTSGKISDYGSLVTLTQLLRLDLSGNSLNSDLTGLGLKKLPLQQLSLANSSVSGSLMPALPIITLEQLDLSGNSSIHIEEEYGSMFAMPKLLQLKIDDNITLPAGLKQKLERMKEAERKRLAEENTRRYHINDDGTVTDTKTKLMWKRCSEGQSGETCSGAASQYKWDDAMSKFRSGVSFAGYSDWRMPTIAELRTLVYCSNGTPPEEAWDRWCSGKDHKAGEYQEPTINLTVFPDTPSYWYWSSTQNGASYVWFVFFPNGRVSGEPEAPPSYVRLVRGGQ